MKKILSIITVILLLVISVLVFWFVFSPSTFLNFFETFPVINKTINPASEQVKESPNATSSESVSAQIGQIIINGTAWNVEVADDEQARINGLSNRKILASKEGMLFVFEDQTSHPFWMKDMLFPIDMIFFDENWKILEIDNNLLANSFPKIFGSDVNSRYVLEINASEALIYGLQVNDQAIFLNK